MSKIKLFVGIALIIDVLLIFFVPFSWGWLPYLGASAVLLAIIWAIAKYF